MFHTHNMNPSLRNCRVIHHGIREIRGERRHQIHRTTNHLIQHTPSPCTLLLLYPVSDWREFVRLDQKRPYLLQTHLRQMQLHDPRHRVGEENKFHLRDGSQNLTKTVYVETIVSRRLNLPNFLHQWIQ